MPVFSSGEIPKKLTVKLTLILNYKSKWIEITGKPRKCKND